MRYLPVVLLVVVTPACTVTVNAPAGKVQFVDNNAAVRVAPIVRLASPPTADDPTLKVELAKTMHAPVYEADEADEVATEVSFDPTRPIAFLFDALFGDGLALLAQPEKLASALTGLDTTVLGTKRVRSESRRTAETREITTPWSAGAVTIDIDDAVSRWVVADDAGVVAVDFAEEVALLPTYPRDALTVKISAATKTDRDEQTFRLDRDTARALYLRGVDMSPHTPGAPPEPVVVVRVDDGLLVVEVTNRGSGATAQLRGTLESPLPALDGREMLFGKIAPGRERAWFTALPLPATTRYAEIPVRIVFSEQNGFAPQELTAVVTVGGD
jgi:hypothetical protein